MSELFLVASELFLVVQHFGLSMVLLANNIAAFHHVVSARGRWGTNLLRTINQSLDIISGGRSRMCALRPLTANFTTQISINIPFEYVYI